MFACGGLGLYFHGQEGLAAIFSLFAAILEKFKFLVLGPLVGPLCNGGTVCKLQPFYTLVDDII